jgi:hypothetical protein
LLAVGNERNRAERRVVKKLCGAEFGKCKNEGISVCEEDVRIGGGLVICDLLHEIVIMGEDCFHGCR